MIGERNSDRRAKDRAGFARVQEIFHAALDVPQNERQRWVEGACGNNRSLLADVLGMLEEDAHGASLLDDGVANLAAQALGPADIGPVQSIGPYRLIRKLGEGGMGMVYLAERDDLGNPVAIKFLRDAWMSPARRERFVSEQRLLASLNHPSIARLYDAGALDNGTPWFAMEYVEGANITEHCAVRQCTLQERLRLFRSVCEAVQYAHERAVIHRDLKPSNILVKPDGSVRLLDFGIARQLSDLQEPVAQTRTALRLMTPAYAAPEQIRGEPVGVFTDVYALGVILYELLTGRPPFDLSNRTPGEAERMIVEDEPEKPSLRATRTGRLEASRPEWADLDVLCQTAIHKDLQRRYRSVEALIRDVDRFLKNEPLESRPDSLLYRARKFIRRNRRALSAAALVIVLITAMAVFFGVRLATARDAALAAAARTQRVQRFMLTLFEGNDKSAAPAESLRVITLVDQGLKEAQTLRNDPEMQADLYQALGGIYQKLGNLARADSLLSGALKQRTARLGADHPDVAESLIALGLLRVDQTRFDDAEKLVREGLRKFVASRPKNKSPVAKATAALGKVLVARGSYDKAIPLLEEAVRLESGAGPETPQLIAILNQLSIAQFYAGHLDSSETLNRRTLALDRHVFGDGSPHVADDLINLGAVQEERQHYREAEQLYRQALDIIQAWYGKEHSETASAMYMLSKPLAEQKRWDEARALLQQAAAIQEHVFGPASPRLANVLNELAIIAYQRNRLYEAEVQFGRVAEIYTTAYGARSSQAALALSNLAGVYLARKEYGRAEQMLSGVVNTFRQSVPDTLNLGIAQTKLGRALLRQRKYQAALEQTLAGYRILLKQIGPSGPRPKAVRKELVEEYEALKQPDQAQRYRDDLKQGTNQTPR